MCIRDRDEAAEKVACVAAVPDSDAEALLRSEMNIELNHPPNLERLVLGCIDAEFCN